MKSIGYANPITPYELALADQTGTKIEQAVKWRE